MLGFVARNPPGLLIRLQAARRLARRLHRDLENRRLGEVQVSVEAYEKLIETLGPDLVSLLASELVLGRVVSWLEGCLAPHQKLMGVHPSVSFVQGTRI